MSSAKAKGPMDDLGLQPHILYTLVNKSARQNTKLTYVHFKTHITIISPHMLKSIKEKSNPIYIYIKIYIYIYIYILKQISLYIA